MEFDELSLLENRTRRLETILGNSDPKHSSKTSITATLAKHSKRVKEVENSSSNLKKVYSQLDDLERLASMCHADTLERSTDAKIDFIEASEKQLREEAKHLENVDKLKWVLDSEHLKSRVTSDLNVRLLQTSQRQADQRDEVAGKLDQTKQLVDNYNQAISAVSKQFEKWNAIVTKLEEQHSIVKE